MPAWAIQRVESVPRDEWRPICLECQWLGDVTDETGCAQVAYAHNRDHHDGAGIEFRPTDMLGPATDEIRRFHRMYRIGAATAVVNFVCAMILVLWAERYWFNDALIGLQILCGMLNAFLAGKWAQRIEAATLEALTPG